MRVRRAVTRAYSAATKNAFSRSSPATASSEEESHAAPLSGARVLGGWSSSNNGDLA